jgi:tryptophan synthase alpha chain
MVSSYSTTGGATGFSDKQLAYFERIQSLGLKNPTVIGFGISSKTDFQTACKTANGAIIGSAFVKMLGISSQIDADIKNFVKEMKG